MVSCDHNDNIKTLVCSFCAQKFPHVGEERSSQISFRRAFDWRHSKRRFFLGMTRFETESLFGMGSYLSRDSKCSTYQHLFAGGLVCLPMKS